MTMERRKRLPDGSFGELEKVFEGETVQERVDRLEAENADLIFASIEKDMRLEELERGQSDLVFTLVEKGVI